MGQGARSAFDDICNRSPEGECEIVMNCFRIIQHSNWKIFLENQLDAVHPSVTHHTTGDAAPEEQKGLDLWPTSVYIRIRACQPLPLLLIVAIF